MAGLGVRLRTLLRAAAGATVLLQSACGGGDGGGATKPQPVEAVTVSLGASTLVQGATTSATATLLSPSGSVLTGRAVTWSSSAPSVATIDVAGVIRTVGAGSTTITASSEGRSGQATLQVLPAVAAVNFTGATRQKVGDSYPIAVSMRAEDGSTISRSVIWKIREAGRATVTASGLVTPIAPGAYTLVAEIDGTEWIASYTAYDWEATTSGTTSFQTLQSDITATNRFGTANYPELVISCGGGFFFVWVRTPHIITASGLVVYAFDAGTIITETWDELSPNYTTLWKRGSNTTIKAFAVQLANARRFTMAFGEFNGSSKAGDWRVTGLAERLPPLFTQCPAALRDAQSTSEKDLLREFRRIATLLPGRGPSAPTSEQAARDAAGAMSPSALLEAWPTWATPETRPAVRVRR